MRFQGLHQFGSGGEGTRDRDSPAEDRAGVRLSLAAPEKICENGRYGGEHEDVADVEQRVPEERGFGRYADRYRRHHRHDGGEPEAVPPQNDDRRCRRSTSIMTHASRIPLRVRSYGLNRFQSIPSFRTL